MKVKGYVNSFWEFFKKLTSGEVCNIGGVRYSNCSIIEALDLVDSIAKISVKRNSLKETRISDHI